MKTIRLRALVMAVALVLNALPAMAANWKVGDCGQGEPCPGGGSPVPTATQTPPPGPSATPTITRTPVPGSFALRINVGSGQSYIDLLGQTWNADQVYGQGNYGHQGSGAAFISGAQVAGTQDDPLYRAYRSAGQFSYRIDLPAGTYEVRLKFMEPNNSREAGERVFDVLAESTVVVDDLDLASAAGFLSAHDRAFDVTVGDGSLDLQLFASVGSAVLSAIEILGLQVAPTLTPTPGGDLDSDADGLPDGWETDHFGNLDQHGDGDYDRDGKTQFEELASGSNPADYYNGVPPTITYVSGNGQTGEVNQLLDDPLVVAVTDSTGNPLVNAPVVFSTISVIDASLQTDPSQVIFGQTVLEVRTDQTGQARVYLRLQNQQGGEVAVSTKAVYEGGEVTVNYFDFNILITQEPDPDDPDGDGLTNAEEAALGTSPGDADTNDDGIRDGDSVAAGIDPINPDQDSDGLSNADELQIGTSPFLADTDEDGVNDALDAFPLDPTRSDPPDPGVGVELDFTLELPTGAILIQED